MTARPTSPLLWPVVAAFCCALASSAGQTFFIGISGGMVREEIGLSEGQYGFFYALATMLSGTIMIWAGAAIDRAPLRWYLAVAFVGLSFVSLGFGLVQSVWMLVLALLGLRLFGQGMLGHATTVIAGRLPDRVRGRALSLSVMGHPVGEFLYPLLAVAALSLILMGRPGLWTLVAALTAVLGGLVVLVAGRIPNEDFSEEDGVAAEAPRLKRSDLLRDRRFLLLQPALLAPPFLSTGFLFHQVSIGSEKGWSLILIGTAIGAYAVGSVVASLATGWLTDRFGVKRVFGWHLLPLVCACLVLALMVQPFSAYLAFALLGTGSGTTAIVGTAISVAIWGRRDLGQVRALMAAIMIYSTAASPWLFGFAVDMGAGWGAVALTSALAILAGIVVARRALQES